MKKFLQISPTSVYHFLLKILAVLIVLNFIAYFVGYYLRLNGIDSHTIHNQILRLFNFYDEYNFPSYFSTINLFISSGLLYYIAKVEKSKGDSIYHKHWLYLSYIFAFLALDELLMFHEIMIKPVRYFLSNSVEMENLGILYHAWVVPYLIFAIAVGLYYFKFVFSLPKRIMLNFIIAGVIFVTGAVGLEMVEGKLAEMAGGENYSNSIYYTLCVALEESMEMFGIILFIRTLLEYIAMLGSGANLLLNLQVVDSKNKPKPHSSKVNAAPLNRDVVEAN